METNKLLVPALCFTIMTPNGLVQRIIRHREHFLGFPSP